MIRLTVQCQLWRYRCDEVFEAKHRTNFENIAVTMERISEELRVRERSAADARDHDGRLVCRLLIAELEGAETTAVKPFQPEESTLPRLYFGGGSRGNPGVAGSGAVLLVHTYDTSRIVWYGAKYLGPLASNNVAEYEALLIGLHAAQDMKLDDGAVFGDSQLISNQLQDRVTVKNETLVTAFKTARELLENTRRFTITHIHKVEHNGRLPCQQSRERTTKLQRRVESSDSGSTWLLRQVGRRMEQDLLFKPHAGAKPRGEATAAAGQSSG